MSKSLGIPITITVLLLSLSGCIDMADKYLMGTDTCSPPCWMEIQPGEATDTDAIRILDTLESEGKGLLFVLTSGIINWRADSVNYYLYLSNGIVNKIEVDLRPRSDTPQSTTLQKIIDLFGEPTNLDLGKIRDGYFFITIFYPAKGLAFVASGDGPGLTLEPKMPILKACFLAPSDLNTMVESLYGINAIADAISTIQVWPGYQRIEP
jgi:hypothetical protein